MNYMTSLACPACDHEETRSFLLEEASMENLEFILHCGGCDEPYYIHFELHGEETLCSVHSMEGNE